MNSQLKFDTYYKYAELTAALEQLSTDFSELCQMGSIGQSYEKRDVWYLTITSSMDREAADKPAIYIDGNTHAGEVTGSMTALYTANYLLQNYGKDPKITRLVDNYTFYIIPRVNPDGAELYLTTPNTLRSSVRVWPDEKISELPGLHREDIDGDGYILNMRVRDDARGAWKISAKDARMMEARKMDDVEGAYYHIYPEGFIKDTNEEPFVVQPVPWGLDLNRNYPSEWNPNIKGGGDYPTSEPEIKNVVDFILSHKNIGALEALHTSGGILFRSPYVITEAEMDQGDLQLLKTIGQRGFELTGYPDVPSTGGVFAATIVDWAYEHNGIPGFTPELWDMYGRAGAKLDWHAARALTPQEALERELKLFEWNDRELFGKGFFNWRQYDHPQLGEVEIGGWNPKFVKQNPPHQLLEQECHKMCQFLLAHTLALPRIAIEDVQVTRIEDQIFKVSALIANHGFLPTNLSNKGKAIKVISPDEVILELAEGTKLLMGNDKIKIGFLEGYYQSQQKRDQTPASSCYRADFVIQAPQGSVVVIKAISQKGGSVSQEITLS